LLESQAPNWLAEHRAWTKLILGISLSLIDVFGPLPKPTRQQTTNLFTVVGSVFADTRMNEVISGCGQIINGHTAEMDKPFQSPSSAVPFSLFVVTSWHQRLKIPPAHNGLSSNIAGFPLCHQAT